LEIVFAKISKVITIIIIKIIIIITKIIHLKLLIFQGGFKW